MSIEKINKIINFFNFCNLFSVAEKAKELDRSKTYIYNFV